MNLINDPWLPVIRASGKPDRIAPWQIVERDDPVMELNAPRPDFQGALYQFLIGLLQTCFAPADHDEWLEKWKEPPEERAVRTKFMIAESAFELINPSGPAFMQDLNLLDGETRKIAALLIDSPGEKTTRDNLDHFIKRYRVAAICHPCAAMALFTLQINAPAGGNGHRVGLRGGGPLTTLVMQTEKGTLWSKLWLNVLDANDFTESVEVLTDDVFPWMGTTRVSTQRIANNVKYYIGDGRPTTPADTHLLQHYWGMPRRIRILSRRDVVGGCDLCGAHNVEVVNEYRTGTWGVDYVGEWVHPLSPYFFDRKKEKPPIAVKGQLGGLGYRHWVGLVFGDATTGASAAKVAKVYMEQRVLDIKAQRVPRLWCFGFDMDKMQARCWYDHTLPLFHLDVDQRKNVLAWCSDLTNTAWDVANNLRTQVKAAWFRRPGDVKGDMGTIVQEFWQQSESGFYRLLERLIALPSNQRLAPPEVYDAWVKSLQSLAYKLFDEWALEPPAEDLDMRRIIDARRVLTKKLSGSKAMKGLIARASLRKEVNNAASTTVSLP